MSDNSLSSLSLWCILKYDSLIAYISLAIVLMFKIRSFFLHSQHHNFFLSIRFSYWTPLSFADIIASCSLTYLPSYSQILSMATYYFDFHELELHQIFQWFKLCSRYITHFQCNYLFCYGMIIFINSKYKNNYK